MPTTADRVFRDFVRYTGDGLANEPTGKPLPVGDPASGVHNPRKSDIRTALNELLTALDASELEARTFESLAALQADTNLTYSGTGPYRVNVGDLLIARKENAVLRVVGSGATDHSLDNNNGTPVKFAIEYWPQDDRGALEEIGLRGQNGAAVKIACYGDSSTLGQDQVVENFNNWPNRLGSILRTMTGNTEIGTYNCGSGGKKLIDYWARDNYASTVIGAYPLTEYVILCFGLNDVKTDVSPVWNVDLFRQRYAELIWQVRLSGRTPIIMTPWPISATAIRPVGLIQGQLLNAVKQVANDHMCDLLDTNAMLQHWHKTRRDIYRVGDLQPDGTHYSDEAHIDIAQMIVRDIFRHRVIDVAHGDRLGPNNAEWASGVTVAYNYNMNNSHGFSAQLTSTGSVSSAAGIWIWSDRVRKAIYVSPDRSIVSGSPAPAVYVNNVGKGTSDGRAIDFGVAATDTVNRPAENHFFVADIPVGLSRLRFDMGGAGVAEFGGWLIVDDFNGFSFGVYGAASFSADAIFLPAQHDSNPCVFPRGASLSWMSIDWSMLPVGWGWVVGSQYVYATTTPATDYGPNRRMQSIVVLRAAAGAADILRVIHEGATIISKTSIKTGGTGTWTGHIAVHALAQSGSNDVLLQVRSEGAIIASHDSDATGFFMSPYGRIGGLFRDNSVASPGDSADQARASCVVHIV
jgi:lysophospholipase L1-like esterase